MHYHNFKFVSCRVPQVTLLLVCIAALVGGCAAGPAVSPGGYDDKQSPQIVEQSADELLNRLKALEDRRLNPLAPAAVVSASIHSEGRGSRLEEILLDRLADHIRNRRQLVRLNRQNWFEYRDNRPLTVNRYPALDRDMLQQMVIYEVAADFDPALAQVRLRIVGHDISGRNIPGLAVDSTMAAAPGTLAAQLCATPAHRNLAPEGVGENPYSSLERISFNLASELATAYKTGIKSGAQTASAEDVKVVMVVKPAGGICEDIFNAAQASLQQALVANSGFEVMLGVDDMAPMFAIMDFYKNNGRFATEETELAAGTILLIAEITAQPGTDQLRIAMRAAWRTAPIISQDGGFIADNHSGSYLSGFTADAAFTPPGQRKNCRLASRLSLRTAIYDSRGNPGYE